MTRRHSVVRRRYRCVASGANTAIIATHQSSDASSACCIGQAWMLADGFGLENSSRAAAVTALTGFQSAIVFNAAGMCSVGTSALDTIASGNSTTRPTLCADSGPLLIMPRQAQPHDSA